jgi:hypothetical protein
MVIRLLLGIQNGATDEELEDQINADELVAYCSCQKT